MKMPPEPIGLRMFAPCGMNCMVCYQHCNHKKPCAGCLADSAGKPAHCRDCRLRDCAREKGLAHCFACAQYPCPPLRRLERSYRVRYGASLLANSRDVERMGLRGFLEKQKQIYTCPACGGAVSLHDGVCSACGQHSE